MRGRNYGDCRKYMYQANVCVGLDGGRLEVYKKKKDDATVEAGLCFHRRNLTSSVQVSELQGARLSLGSSRACGVIYLRTRCVGEAEGRFV